MFKLLLKRSFKGLFLHKVFSILLIILVILSGAIYTILESTSSSFNASYNDVINKGKLHDFVIKENFKQSDGSNFKVKGVTNTSGMYELTDENIKANARRGIDNEYFINLGVGDAIGDFNDEDIIQQTRSISFNYNGVTLNDDSKKIIEDGKLNFKSLVEFNAKQKLSIRFTDALREEYDSELFLKETHSISISSGNKSFKVVRFNNVLGINQLVINDGSSLFTEPLTTKQLKDQLEKRIDKNKYSFNTTKGFKVTATTVLNKSENIIDPSSYQAIISPAYANINEKKSISPTEFQKILKINPEFMANLITDNVLKMQYDNNLIWVDQTPFIIIGIGTTPDFANPIIDGQHPTVDPANQAIVYTNVRGFQRTYDAFRTNEQENYISARFKKNITQEKKAEIKTSVEHFARGQDANGKALPLVNHPTSAWPRNVKIVTNWNDSNDQLLLTQERVIFLEQLKNTIRTVSLMTTFMLIVFVGSIVILVLQAIIAINKKQFATLLSLGMSKWKLGLSEAIAFTVLIGTSTIIAYGIGHGMQFIAINSFSNYWTLPTYGVLFSLTSLLVIVALPLLLVGLTIILLTIFSLRFPLPKMLQGRNDPSSIILTKIISKLRVVGISGRYAIALSTKNIWKIFLIFITSTISITAIIVGMGSFGKGMLAYNETANVQKFTFRVNLNSPTKEGGQYGTINYKDLVNENIIPMEVTYGPPGTISVDLLKPHWHIPSIGDLEYGLPDNAQNNLVASSTYLKNKLQIETLLNRDLGLNPWDIAKKLMPENQLNKTIEDSKSINQLINGPNTKVPDEKLIAEKIAVKKVIGYHLSDQAQASPYIISYNNVIIDYGDEKYTYLDTSIDSKKMTILGIDSSTKMVDINDQLKKLESNTDELPLLINKYISKKYDLNNGSTIDFTINNDSTRNFKDHNPHIVKGVIRGIVNGYNDAGIYTLKSKANTILGLNVIDGFNGIFSKNKNPAIINTLPLYSESGLYPGTDSFSGAWNSVLSNMLKNNDIWKYSDTIANDSSSFIDKYSSTPFVAAISDVSWDKIDRYTFNNISKLISFMIISIESISIIMALIFTIIITSLLIRANYTKIATLWTIGYRKWEISKIFLTMYLLPVILAGIFGTLISLGVFVAMTEFTMNFGHILIPFGMSWWMPIAAVIGILFLFMIITFSSIMRLKADTVLAAFKEQ
ncbi:ABC transporter permease [Candidatus Mycoplasma mahonii]|uniref:ABC transporter permease n=1 Tax=Candidatus Mycoplasma mahonii TaxID=3004105 RepID=UPI0026F2FC79|nr:ABC transporter permease [Candidatus Mycoplasma mahonii]WKX02389.1 ABC transporter permease [Candidatus Mycoplasma mahonii]